jgi:hypothetical protein
MELEILSPRSQRPVQSNVECETWLFYLIFCIVLLFKQ